MEGGEEGEDDDDDDGEEERWHFGDGLVFGYVVGGSVDEGF